ncbi:protein rotatin homolog [Drosophila nasuta]|uniref:protein rotatin homolog n=1 Tax=Drosophila nasuta TaxID=42062 RepID=UPI00295ED7FD|nr:protein rotatin homolog [Drosophila nasuta]
MSTSSRQMLTIGENLLAKLTNEAPEIRMRALEQVETRFMRGLQHDEQLNLNPIVFTKQLIGWFNFKPPIATDRVLSLMLELLRSDYGDGIMPSIPVKRLREEMSKIHQLLSEYPSERGFELIEDLRSRITKMHMDAMSPVESSSSCRSSDNQLSDSYESDYIASRDRLRLSPTDHETAWTRPSDTDLLTMKIIVDSLTVSDEMDLKRNLTNLQIKLCDYPIEYFLQPPNVYLRLIHIQQKHSGDLLQHINRVLFAFLKQLKQRHRVRSKILSYSAPIEAPKNPQGMPDQLRFSKALTVLLYGSFKQVGSPTLEHCVDNWHCFELIDETIQTMIDLSVRVPDYIVEKMGIMVAKLLIYLRDMKMPKNGDVSSLVKRMMIPRLESLILNELLVDVIGINVDHNPKMNKAAAYALLHAILTDDVYLMCFPDFVEVLENLSKSLNIDVKTLKNQMYRLKVAYSTAVNQLVETTKIPPLQLLRKQGMVCLVLNQMGSETLLRQLVEALIKCTPCYGQQRELRQDAESLLSTFFNLPNEQMRGQVLRLLKQPVVDHFHAFLNHTNYMAGCNNIELARQHILGLPMSTELVRQLLVQGWMPNKDAQGGQEQLQQWCVDYLIMIMGLAKLIGNRDFVEVFEMVVTQLPLMICRGVNYPQLQQNIWGLMDPDKRYVDPSVALRANACYLFHPDAKFRKEAISRVAYVLMRHDSQNHKYRTIMDQLTLDLIGHDLCVVRPPIDYATLFNEKKTLSDERNLLALQRLLETPDLKPAIRKSTLVQLNVLLHNREAVKAFTNNERSCLLCLNALRDPLLGKRQPDAMDMEILMPATSILMRMLFCSAHTRIQLKDNEEILMCLLRCLFLMPHNAQLRAELSCCIFQLLYEDHLMPTESTLFMNVNLSPLMVPVCYQVDHAVPPTATTEGTALQNNLLAKHFQGNKELAAQHWRLYIAHWICESAESMEVAAVQKLDIDDSLKLTPKDMALVQATLVHEQLRQQLLEANNCSSHQKLLHHVASLQLFLVLLHNNVPQQEDEALWSLLHRFLPTSPGNQLDHTVYFALLELCSRCLQYRLPAVLTGLNTALETDAHHSFFIVLRDLQVNLPLLQLVTGCLVQLLHAGDGAEVYDWHGRLFMELSKLARSHFEERRLQHVRSLLTVLRHLSARQLNMEDIKLQAHYQHFVQLSSNLRTSTQTGAQWQRDCLLIMCQLQAQAQCPAVVAISTGHGTKVFRYLLGLCGHCDAEVRTLAWVTMANWLKSSDVNMANILLEFLDFLPGGLGACCLSTMLDGHEQILVREMAGRVFERLMPHQGSAACVELLSKYAFLQEAHKALATLEISPQIADNAEGVKNSCEIIGCFVSILIKLVQLQPSWCTTLCEHAFFHALSDVMKLNVMQMQPQNTRYSKAYMELCAGQICKLYAICYQHNFEFLQRSICRDTVLLKSFFALMHALHNQRVVHERLLENMLKLMMVFCKDGNSYRVLYDHLKLRPELLMDGLMHGCSLVLFLRPVQRYAFTMFSLLLTKMQYEPKDDNLLRQLETYAEVIDLDESKDENANVDVTDSDDNENNNDENDDSEEVICKRLKIMNLRPINTTNKKGHRSKKPPDSAKHTELSNCVGLLFYTFNNLFEMHFPAKTYSFLQAPSRNHIQLCELMGNLLKLSPFLMEAARNVKLLDRIIQLMESFLDDTSVGNASAYVRRVGAHKTREILGNLMLICNMLMHWHSSSHSVITDTVMANRIVRVILRLWPWLSHSGMLKHFILCWTGHLTEHSFEMCKQASLVLSNQSHSLLQMMMRVADHETTKKDKTSTKPNPFCVLETTANSFVEAALRVMINCCSCTEGRLSLSKMRVLDMFDTILPASQSLQNKVRQEALLSWLNFWEIYSRYDAGNKVCHMAALLDAVRRSPPLGSKRMTCLRILRNMCFANSNRTQLIGFHEFQDLMHSILLQPVAIGGGGDASLNSYEEHCLVILCLWKLFGFTAKHRALLRSSKMFKQIDKLKNQLTILESENLKRFESFPFAKDTSDMLGNLYKAVQI